MNFSLTFNIGFYTNKNLEMMLLAKHGGGVGVGINQIRPAGSEITMNGTSDGTVPFCKIYDSSILATNQGAVRRGAASVNLNIDHKDWEDWLEIRERRQVRRITRIGANLSHRPPILPTPPAEQLSG